MLSRNQSQAYTLQMATYTKLDAKASDGGVREDSELVALARIPWNGHGTLPSRSADAQNFMLIDQKKVE